VVVWTRNVWLLTRMGECRRTIRSVFVGLSLAIMNWTEKWTYGFEYRTVHIIDLDRKWTTAISSPTGVIFWYDVIIIMLSC
jgi:hypothetical protein